MAPGSTSLAIPEVDRLHSVSLISAIVKHDPRVLYWESLAPLVVCIVRLCEAGVSVRRLLARGVWLNRVFDGVVNSDSSSDTRDIVSKSLFSGDGLVELLIFSGGAFVELQVFSGGDASLSLGFIASRSLRKSCPNVLIA